MKVRVLGSAAGGGCPQWNCACRNCRGARDGSVQIEPRTQECVAVSADGEAWFLLHLEGLESAPSDGDNVGFRIREHGSGRVLVYLSAVGRLTREVISAAERADCLFFDGTFWSEDELRELGASEKRAGDMAHLPIDGEGGSLATLGGLRTPRRIYIHLNNTNPVLREDSPERATVERAGWH